MSDFAKLPYSLATARGKASFKDGKLFFIWGGDGERDIDPKDQDDVDAADDPDQDGDQDQSDPSDDVDDDKQKQPTLEEQLDEEKRKRLKVERELAKKDKAAKDAEADKDAVKDRDRYKAKLEARDKFLAENLLLMEINKQSKYKFVDADDVVTIIQRKYSDEVTIDLDADIPTVEGLDLALKRIAKDKPHFIKKDDKDEDRPPSGTKLGGGKLESDEAEVERLGKKFKLPGFGMQAVRPV